MNIINIDPSTDPLWKTLLTTHKSDVFNAPEWLEVLKDTYDFDIRALVTMNGAAEPKSGIAYCLVKDMMDPRIISLPFSDFCDPPVADYEDWHALLDQLLKYDFRIIMRCLHNDVPLADKRLSMVNRAKWHAVDLQRSVEELWMGLDGSARRAVKKARRNNVTVRIAANKEDLRAFYTLHLQVRKYKYQLLAQPYRFFENIWDHFIANGNGALMVAEYENQIIGGVLFLKWQDRLYYKFNASNPDYINFRPNDLVIWEGMQYGKEHGYEYLDFGLSDWEQEGLLRYKRKYATDEKTVSFLRYGPESSPSPREQELRNLLPQITDLFVDQCVPDNVSEKAGNILYRLFT